MTYRGIKAPVKEGDIITEACINIGKKGDGIFKLKGYTIIVPDTIKGRSYEIKITKALSKVAFGEVQAEF